METEASPEIKSSTHKAEVVEVVLEKHPDADRLSIAKVYGYDCVVNTEDWAGITKAVYIVPDTVCDVRRPEFSFLAEQAKANGLARIKAKRIRGVVSKGLLVPAPESAKLGDDLYEQLGLARYEPPEPGASATDKFVIGGEECAGPNLETGPSKYDVDAFERYARDIFLEGEPVAIYEKIDGCLHEDSEISMSDGTIKKIKDVTVGELVKSFNLLTKEFEDKEVETVFAKEPACKWIELNFDNGKSLICTEDHLILTDLGWVEAQNLTENHDIVSV